VSAHFDSSHYASSHYESSHYSRGLVAVITPGGGLDDDLIPRRNRRKAIREAEELQLLMFIVAVIDQEDQ
jgi:hypothetical protein